MTDLDHSVLSACWEALFLVFFCVRALEHPCKVVLLPPVHRRDSGIRNRSRSTSKVMELTSGGGGFKPRQFGSRTTSLKVTLRMTLWFTWSKNTNM